MFIIIFVVSLNREHYPFVGSVDAGEEEVVFPEP